MEFLRNSGNRFRSFREISIKFGKCFKCLANLETFCNIKIICKRFVTIPLGKFWKNYKETRKLCILKNV